MQETKTDEAILAEYRATVRHLIETKAGDPVNNWSPRHAAIIVEEMVSHVEHSFIALSGRMSMAVWSPAVLERLALAKRNGVSVRFLVQNECASTLAGVLPKDLQGSVRKIAADIPASAIPNHFTVVDGRVVRMETNAELKEALFTANNSDLAAAATKAFDVLYAKSPAYA